MKLIYMLKVFVVEKNSRLPQAYFAQFNVSITLKYLLNHTDIKLRIANKIFWFLLKF